MSFSDFIKTNSAARQGLLAAGVCLVLAVLIGWAYFNFLQPRYAVLFSGLRDADAATIVAELDKQKASYKLQDGGQTILMPAELVAKTRLGLMTTALPLKGTVGFELFNKSDMGLTEFAQQINYQRALQGELSRTIMAMDGVDEARIHLALPEHAIFREEAKPPKASVTVLMRPGKTLSAATIRGVQRLVAASIPDLDIANVVVLDGKGDVVSDPNAAPVPGPSDDVHAAEALYESVVRTALQASFPRRPINVAIWAGGNASTERPSSPDAPRSFPLHVALTVSPPSSPTEEQAIRSVVLAAIHADPNQDVITYTVSAPPPVPEPAPAAAVPSATFSAPQVRDVVIAAALVALAVVVGLVALRARRGPALTPRQRAAYAARLRAALDARSADEAA